MWTYHYNVCVTVQYCQIGGSGSGAGAGTGSAGPGGVSASGVRK
jgi:hypothetical protein